MESINLLTRSQICGDMCIAADNPQESTCSGGTTTCDELDGDGAGAAEGAGDGRGGELLSGGSNIDIHSVFMNIETFKGEGDFLSIG